MRPPPELQRERHWIDVRFFPPRLFIAMSMDFAVMQPADGHRVLIANLSAERARLGEAQMMSVGREPAANETRQGGDKSQVLFVAQANDLARNGRMRRAFFLAASFFALGVVAMRSKAIRSARRRRSGFSSRLRQDVFANCLKAAG